MIPTQTLGNESTADSEAWGKPDHSQKGFTLIEIMLAMLILLGSFVMITGVMPLAAIVHRAAQERQVALSLAQAQMEHFLTNPGPVAGTTGTQSSFINAAQFPVQYTGYWAGQAFAGGGGLTLIVVRVTPPHGPRVEISAIDTTTSF
jgi:prepilin-type N-terminal cleavage/methylation domain-containing protein